MTRKRAVRGLAATAVAAAISVGAAGPALGQYGEEPPPGVSGISGVSGSGTSNLALRKKCIAKAQTKFGDNKPKRKAAIRKCKKKYRV
jgi:hypothetical protein